MNKLVVKDNSLIDASFNLSVIEQRLMLLAIVEARELKRLTSETAIEVKAITYKDQYKVDESEAYKQLREAGKTLKRREFTYLDKYKGIDVYSTVNWVNKITYVPTKGMIVLKLSAEVIELVSRLEANFTQYLLDQVSEFKSKYSIRLYELVVKWIKLGTTEKYEITDLRSKLGILETEYKSVAYLKRDVLDKAVKEINEKSDLDVKYEQFKVGRNITHIQFKIKKATSPKIKKPKALKPLTPKQIDMFSDKLARSPKFQSHFIAEIGQSEQEYKEKIALKLQDSFYVDAWMDYLVEVGYKKNA